MKYKELNDYELLYMVRESNDDIRDVLYIKYQPLIKNLSSEFYEKYKNYSYDYDDFLQEAYIAFEKALINYNDKRENLFYTFVVVCIRRRLFDFVRKITNNKKEIPLILYSDEDEENVLVKKTDITDNMIADERIESIRQFMLNLSFEFSVIFELRINGFNYREISDLLDIPRSTIEYRMRKIRQKAKIKYKGTF